MILNPLKYFKFLVDAEKKIDAQAKETKRVIEETKSILNGENQWFLDAKNDEEEIKLECVCKKVNHVE